MEKAWLVHPTIVTITKNEEDEQWFVGAAGGVKCNYSIFQCPDSTKQGATVTIVKGSQIMKADRMT